MTKKKTLSDSIIRSLETPDNRTEIYDQVVDGMILRVTKTGHKSFALRYWFDGQSKQYTIGKYGDVTLAEARKKARELKQVVNDGIDPQREKKKKKYQPKEYTFSELVSMFQKQHLPTLKESTRFEYERIINNELLKRWKKIPVSDISSHLVREVLNKKAYEEKSFTMANRIRSVISKIFEFGIHRVGLNITHNPVDATKVFEQGENIRDRVYDEDEIKELWEFWSTLPEPIQSVYKLLLLTGQRKSEVMNMRWSDIEPNKLCKRIRIENDGRAVPESFEAHVWTIPDTKNKTIHQIPLSDMAFDIIQDLKPLTGDSEYVFESPRKRGFPLNSLNSTDKMIKRDTSVHDFRIHDLRRTFTTKTEECGVEFFVIKKVLNHKSGDITQRHYAWYDYMDKKLVAVNRWSMRLHDILHGKEEMRIHKIGG